MSIEFRSQVNSAFSGCEPWHLWSFLIYGWSKQWSMDDLWWFIMYLYTGEEQPDKSSEIILNPAIWIRGARLLTHSHMCIEIDDELRHPLWRVRPWTSMKECPWASPLDTSWLGRLGLSATLTWIAKSATQRAGQLHQPQMICLHHPCARDFCSTVALCSSGLTIQRSGNWLGIS